MLCGGGAQTRELQCQETATQVTVDMSECEGDEPITSRECNMEKCVEVEWVYCGWDACTAQCGGGANGGAGGGSMMGIRSRQAMCMTVEDTPRLVNRNIPPKSSIYPVSLLVSSDQPPLTTHPSPTLSLSGR